MHYIHAHSLQKYHLLPLNKVQNTKKITLIIVLLFFSMQFSYIPPAMASAAARARSVAVRDEFRRRRETRAPSKTIHKLKLFEKALIETLNKSHLIMTSESIKHLIEKLKINMKTHQKVLCSHWETIEREGFPEDPDDLETFINKSTKAFDDFCTLILSHTDLSVIKNINPSFTKKAIIYGINQTAWLQFIQISSTDTYTSEPAMLAHVNSASDEKIVKAFLTSITEGKADQLACLLHIYPLAPLQPVQHKGDTLTIFEIALQLKNPIIIKLLENKIKQTEQEKADQLLKHNEQEKIKLSIKKAKRLRQRQSKETETKRIKEDAAQKAEKEFKEFQEKKLAQERIEREVHGKEMRTAPTRALDVFKLTSKPLTTLRRFHTRRYTIDDRHVMKCPEFTPADQAALDIILKDQDDKKMHA